MAEGLLVAGTAMSVWGQIEEADANASQARDQATLRSIEAKETLERARLNEESLLAERDVTLSMQASGFAAGNVDITQGGTPLAVAEATASFYKKEISNMYREANFRGNQLEREASSLRGSADSIKKAGYMRAVGSIVTSSGNVAMANKK